MSKIRKLRRLSAENLIGAGKNNHYNEAEAMSKPM
jgi:hypothetical protein